MDLVLAFIVGVSLAAACGFRVFVPLLVMSIAAKAGMLELSDGWSWIGSWPALIAFSVATTAEVGGYYIPWVDNLLDTIASPAAVVAGTIATAACISDMHPLLAWSAAVVVGGGVAGAIQAATVFGRGTSTATTGGLGNFVVATFELAMSLALSVLAVVVPIVAGVVMCVVVFLVARRFLRRRSRQAAALKA